MSSPAADRTRACSVYTLRMMRSKLSLSALVALSLAGCEARQPTHTQSIHANIYPHHSGSAAGQDARMNDDASAACDASGYPTLVDYSDVREGAPFSLLVRREPSGAWVSVEQLRMPMHHASSLVFEPAIDTLVSESQRDRPVLVLAVGIGRRAIEHDPRRHTWFATYAARVVRVERTCER